jgi:hypothetical protein
MRRTAGVWMTGGKEKGRAGKHDLVWQENLRWL